MIALALFFLQIVLAIKGLPCFHKKLELFVLVLRKMSLAFFGRYFIDCLKGDDHFNNISSSSL